MDTYEAKREVKKINKKDLVEKNISSYDKKHKTNVSNEKLDINEYFNDINKGINLEDLENLDIPIFKYKTQLTLHGIWENLNDIRVRGYKSIVKNNNKSIGIKWSVIDEQKRSEIYKYIQHDGYIYNRTSSEHSFFKIIRNENLSKEDYEQLLNEYEKINENLFFGEKRLYRKINQLLSIDLIVIEIKINGIYQKNVDKFINCIIDKDLAIEKQKELEKKRELKDQKYEKNQKIKEKKNKRIENKILSILKDLTSDKIINKINKRNITENNFYLLFSDSINGVTTPEVSIIYTFKQSKRQKKLRYSQIVVEVEDIDFIYNEISDLDKENFNKKYDIKTIDDLYRYEIYKISN